MTAARGGFSASRISPGSVERSGSARAPRFTCRGGKVPSSARESADKARRLLQDGTDPIEAKAQARDKARKAAQEKKAAAKCERATLARVARAYHERVIEGSRSPKHAAQWIASLEANVPPELWQKPIAEVTAQELLAALIGLQARVPETASRVRQRLDAIFEDAVFHGLAAANPAATIRRKLREAKGRRVRGQFQALAYGETPALVARLRQMEGIAARALEFAILTASRTSEVLGATWAEFDAALWTVPAGRMKAREAHTAHLCDRALAILEGMRALKQSYVFPAPALDGRPLSNMAMLMCLRRLGIAGETTVHGFRSTFSTWANETGAARPDVVEVCPRASRRNLVRAAYRPPRRSRAAPQRPCDAWAAFCDGGRGQRDSTSGRESRPLPRLARRWSICGQHTQRSFF